MDSLRSRKLQLWTTGGKNAKPISTGLRPRHAQTHLQTRTCPTSTLGGHKQALDQRYKATFFVTECEEQKAGLSIAWVNVYTSMYLPHVDMVLPTGSHPMRPGSLHLLSIVRDASDHISNQLAWSVSMSWCLF